MANGTVQLTDLQGGLYQQITDLPLVASSLTFNVHGGVNGFAPNSKMVVPLEIQLSSPPTIVGQAGANINIDSVQGSLTVGGPISIDGQILEGLTSTSGDVTLESALSILDGIDRSSGDQTADITANNISLTTGGTTGNIGVSPAAPLYIDSKKKLTATTNQNAYLVETKGNLTLNQVNALFGTVFLTVPSGSIVNGNTGGPNVVAVNAYLSASQNVGTTSLPIDTQVSYLEGLASFRLVHRQQRRGGRHWRVRRRQRLRRRGASRRQGHDHGTQSHRRHPEHDQQWGHLPSPPPTSRTRLMMSQSSPE